MRFDEAGYMRAIEAAARRRPPVLLLAAIPITAAIVLCCLLWAHFAVLEVVTRAEGRVIPSRQVQVVQNLEGGILRELLVREGALVREGEVVARMDGTTFAAEARSLSSRRHALAAAADRLEAEASGRAMAVPPEIEAAVPEAVAREHDLFALRQVDLQSNLDILTHQATQREGEVAGFHSRRRAIARSMELLEQELAMTRELAEKGLKSRADLLRGERQMADLQNEAEATTAKLPTARAAVAEAQRRKEERVQAFRSAALQELTRVKAEIAGIDAQAVAYADRVKRREIRAPMDGIVKRIALTTLGGVLQPGTPLMEIVPQDDTLLIEGRVKPSDVAFLRSGQPATVRISAFDSTIYGSLPATLEHISADTMPDRDGSTFYLVRARTAASSVPSGGGLDILPGMTATLDIITGRQSVLHYLLKPVIKARDVALRER